MSDPSERVTEPAQGAGPAARGARSVGAPPLARTMGLHHATAMVVGTIIGASIFVQPSEITGRVPTPAGIHAVWIVCGVLTLFGALVSAELASTLPESGGVYAYLREAFSPGVGFLWGWAMFWTMHSGIVAAVAVVCARYAAFFLPLDGAGVRGFAVAVILLLSWVNYVGVRHGSRLQTAVTAGKVVAIGAIVALGFAFGGEAHETVAAARTPAGEGVEVGEFTLAIVAGLFAFGGWHMVTYGAEETVDPRHTLPRALVLGTFLVTACYLALNAVYLYVLPLEVVASSDRVAADAADVVFGRGGGAALSALVVFSTFGSVSGIILAGPRVYWAMARDGLLFRWVGAVHPRHQTPHRAIALQAVWASILALTGTYRTLFTRVIYTEWIFFGLMAVGLVLLRRRSDLTRSYSVWGYPWVPLLFAVSAFGIVAHHVAAEPGESAWGLGLVLAGLPVYHFWARRGYVSASRSLRAP